jgi:class 3 adenylate cyclase
VLIAVFMSLWTAALCLHVREGLRTGDARLPFSVSSAAGADRYPLVLRPWIGIGDALSPPLESGDVLLAVEGADLRGVTAIGFFARAYGSAGVSAVELEVEREGVRFPVRARPIGSGLQWWTVLPAYLGLGLVALFLLVRAPHWHVRRLFFASSISWCLYGAWFFGAGGWLTHANAILHDAAALLGPSLGLIVGFKSAERAPRLSPWQIVLSLGLGLAVGGFDVWLTWLPVPPWSWILAAYNVTLGLALLAMVAGIVWSARYSTPLERRQGKWVLFGFYVAVLPFTCALLLEAARAPIELVVASYVVTRIGLVAVPLGILISIVGYGFLDIDRIWSAAATSGLLGVASVAAVLIGVPPLAEALSSAAGFGSAAGRWVLSIALAAVLVPLYRVVHPRIERTLFAERRGLELGFQDLLADLRRSRGLGELVEKAVVGVDALWRPVTIAAYAKAGAAFDAILARGRAVPPVFPADGPLAAALGRREAPLAAKRWARGEDAAGDPFDRAALEALDAAAVVPVRRDGGLIAFVCLGPKRSGDIYTNSDLSLLAALGHTVSGVLERLDAGQMAQAARELQNALRRYVPGPVADRVESGAELEPGEREVTVLFADIRGYTPFAEPRAPDEIFATISRYAEAVTRIVQAHGGDVVEFQGDGLMAVFGALDPLPDRERAAVEAAREIAGTVPKLFDAAVPLGVGVGVASGPAFVGNVRSGDRLVWSVLGNTTNLAARLQALTRELDACVAIDAPTWRAAGPAAAAFVPHPDVALRGRRERCDVFALPSLGERPF